MGEQVKDEPKVIACPRCGGEMVKCRIDTPWAVLRPVGSKVGVLEDHKSYIGAMVCYTCGYIMEWVALAPEELDPAKWRDKLLRRPASGLPKRINESGDQPYGRN